MTSQLSATSIEVRDLLSAVDWCLSLLFATDQDTAVEAAMTLEWTVGMSLFLEEDDPAVRLVGAAILLGAIRSMPEVLDEALQRLSKQVLIHTPLVLTRKEEHEHAEPIRTSAPDA